MARHGELAAPDPGRRRLTPDLEICRILIGMWQVAGAHGPIDHGAAVRAMFDYHDAGFTTWDLADIYGPAEILIGEFRRQLAETRGAETLAGVQAFTKWVPDPAPMTRSYVEEQIDVARERMGVEALDLLQLHWWDYRDESYLTALRHLTVLQRDGKIRHLGLTNFDTEHLGRVVESGFDVVSHQVQYSLIDRRPERRMAPFCLQRNIQLLAYGTLCGGLLSKRFLGQTEPRPNQLFPASLNGYKALVDRWGGWDLFQELLFVLSTISEKHRTSLSGIALRWVLDRPAVAGAIVGARLGVSDRFRENARVLDLVLDQDDHARIDAVLEDSRDLYPLIGDCGDELRSRKPSVG